MASKALKDFKVLIFDVYGTLVDWETGINSALQPLLSQSTTDTSIWSKKALLTAFSSVERDLQAKHPSLPYNELLGEVYKALRERIALASAVESGSAETALEADLASASGLNQAASTSESELEYDAEAQAAATFARSLGSWPLFPDTLSALNSLKRLGYALVLLSNVDDASIRQMTLPRLDPETYTMPTRARTGGIPPGGNSRSNSKHSSESLFAGVLTAEQLGAYKPDPRVLSAALEHIETSLGVNSEDVLVVAQSLFHDHVPAKSLGLKTVWVDREGSEMGLGVGEGEEIWDWRFASLEEIVKAVEDERKADGGIVSSG